MSEHVSIVTKEQKAVQQRSYCKQGRVERGYCGYQILPGLTAVGVLNLTLRSKSAQWRTETIGQL